MSGTVTIGKVRLADEFLSHQIDSIEAEQAVMSARVTTVEDEVSVVKSNAEASSTTAVSDRVTTVEQDVAAAGQDLSAVSTRVTAVEQDIGALESQDTTLASATTAVSNRVTATEQDIAAAESDISALETDWNSFKSVAYVSGGTSLNIDRTDGAGFGTVLSTNANNYIRGSTFFRIANETTSRAYISTNGLMARATNTTAYQVGDTLQDLLARVADIEQNYVDTRKTVKLYSHVAGKYMDHGGNLGATSDQNMGDYLEETHYDAFRNSSQFMAIYDSAAERFVELNESMKTRMGSATVGTIKTLVEAENSVYLTVSGIPCRLKKLVNLTSEIHMVEIFPAHTKTWNQSSDLVQLTDLTSDGVWEWFPPLNFEYMSQRYWDILGYDQKEMHEKPNAWMDLINQDDLKRVLKMNDEHVESKGGVPYHATVRYTHKNGKEVFVLCRGSIVDWLPDGTPWRMLGTHTDVTDIVKKDAVEAQSVFIARMSHEIRSPICTILNECELLENQAQTNVISKTCQQLISLMDDILSLGDSKSDTLQLDQKEVNLHTILSQCNKRHRLEAKKKGIRVRMSTGDLPDNVLMDEVRFNQIVDNLLNNAIKYSDSGVITIDVEYDEDDHVCEVRVQDEGQGIPAAMHAKVFEEFVQGDKTMQGAGIGLTLTKTLSGIMGGNVVIERSKEGVGTTVLFTSILPKPKNNIGSQEPLRVLVVDDMRTNRTILTRRLECIKKLGVKQTQITEAVDGQDACDKFVSANGNFQLILMDCLMPVVDGFEATTKIHDECAKLGIAPVPVVAVTASVSSDIREKCLSHGMKFVVTKPYTEQDLLLSIQACIKNEATS